MADPAPRGVALADPHLALAADVLDDIERVRIANANRLGALTRSTEDSDGRVRGFGLDESHPDVARLAAIVVAFKCDALRKPGEKRSPQRKGCCLEHDAERHLAARVRAHPLGPWLKSVRGVGDKQGARLLAAIGGDPYLRPEYQRADDETLIPEGPRTVSALWALCGLHVIPADQESNDTQYVVVGGDGGDPGRRTVDTRTPTAGVAPKRRRGQKANWSTKAKTRAYLVAVSCLKQLIKPCTGDAHVEDCQCSPYRVVYDQRRMHTARTHPDWPDGHSHNDALRVAAKAFLRDLWREALRLHEEA
jgi:hypothetical protein